MQMGVKVKSRSEPLGKADGARCGVFYTEAFGFFYEGTVDLFRDDFMDRGEELFIGMNPVAHGNGKRDNKLPVGDKGQYVIYQVMGCFCHALSATTRTVASFLTREGDDFFFIAASTGKP